MRIVWMEMRRRGIEGPRRRWKTISRQIHCTRYSGYLMRYYGKKVIILLDEYDTPMQEAYLQGYWEEMVAFIRSLFNATFKTNPHLGRAVMTGITCISRESMFSDPNNRRWWRPQINMKIPLGLHSRKFGRCWKSMSYYRNRKKWEGHDGLTFGERRDIYNPWSIINYLDKREAVAYWVDTSSNSLAGRLVRKGGRKVKETMENLMERKFSARGLMSRLYLAIWIRMIKRAWMNICTRWSGRCSASLIWGRNLVSSENAEQTEKRRLCGERRAWGSEMVRIWWQKADFVELRQISSENCEKMNIQWLGLWRADMEV